VTAGRELLLSQTFVQLVDTLTEEFDMIELLTVLGEGCVDIFAGAESSIVLSDSDGELHLMAASSDRVRALDLAALQRREGPGVKCFRSGCVVGAVLDGSHEWGRFGHEAARAGLHAVDALPMRHRDTTIGALDIYRTEATALAPGDVAIAQALADAATIAIVLDHAARESQGLVAQLHVALNSRIAIEQAKGALAERANIDTQEAFVRLRRYARDHNRKLSVVAQELVGGTLPPEATAALVSGRLASRRSG
jgi:hypothetical protein